MLLFASAALCSCVGTSPEPGKPKVKKSLSEYMQDNMANSIANVPTGLLGTTPGQQQAHQERYHGSGDSDLIGGDASVVKALHGRAQQSLEAWFELVDRGHWTVLFSGASWRHCV